MNLYVRCAATDPVADPYRPYSARGVRLSTTELVDHLPQAGVEYEYRLVGVADDGSVVDSGWGNAAPTIPDAGALT